MWKGAMVSCPIYIYTCSCFVTPLRLKHSKFCDFSEILCTRLTAPLATATLNDATFDQVSEMISTVMWLHRWRPYRYVLQDFYVQYVTRIWTYKIACPHPPRQKPRRVGSLLQMNSCRKFFCRLLLRRGDFELPSMSLLLRRPTCTARSSSMYFLSWMSKIKVFPLYLRIWKWGGLANQLAGWEQPRTSTSQATDTHSKW